MATDDDIGYASALALVERYRTGALSPVEAAGTLLSRLDRLQPSLNAFCIVNRDGALAAARQSEERWRRRARPKRAGCAASRAGRSTACR